MNYVWYQATLSIHRFSNCFDFHLPYQIYQLLEIQLRLSDFSKMIKLRIWTGEHCYRKYSRIDLLLQLFEFFLKLYFFRRKLTDNFTEKYSILHLWLSKRSSNGLFENFIAIVCIHYYHERNCNCLIVLKFYHYSLG